MKDVIWISAVGAGLVIVGLMILWLFMDLLVRLTTIKTKNITSLEIEEDSSTEMAPLNSAKRFAAAAAVSVAFLMASQRPANKRSENEVNAWQGSHRHSQLHNIPLRQSLKRNTK